MDADPPVPPSSAPKKLKFKPKAPPRRKTGPILPKSESSDDDAEARKDLLRKVKHRYGTRSSKVEKKTSGNVTLPTHGAGIGSSSTQPSTQVQPKDGDVKRSSNLMDSLEKSISQNINVTDEAMGDDEFEPSIRTKKEYKEPWDPHSYYPISLPWRPLGSGNPEILNAQEFGEEEEYDENGINSAKELGLLENDDQEKLIVFKFPPKLPLDKQTHRAPLSAKGEEKVESFSSLKEDAFSDLKDLPNGYVGKMLVYKSGAIKLKLGDIIFDVSPGIRGEDAQDVAVMNSMSKKCFVVGQVDKQAVVTPDLNSIDFDQL